MPYRWSGDPATGQRLDLWPHRSLSVRAFAAFIAATAVGLALPLTSLLGRPALWFVLVPAALTLAALWLALRRNSREARRGEVLTLDRQRIEVVNRMRAAPRTWTANPYWTEVRIRPEGGPVPDYLTLKGAGREVELGAFLSPGERKALADDLRAALAGLRTPG